LLDREHFRKDYPRFTGEGTWPQILLPGGWTVAFS